MIGHNPYEAPRVEEDTAETVEPDAAPPTSSGLVVTYRNSEEDIGAFVDTHFKKAARAVWVFAVLMFVTAFVAVYQGAAALQSRYIELQAVFLATAFSAPAFLAIRNARKRTKRRILESRKPPLTTLSLTPSGIVVRDDRGAETRESWSSIPNIEATESHIFLYNINEATRVVSALTVPRRAFSTSEAADAFLRAARAWHSEARSGAVRPDLPVAIPAEGDPRFWVTYSHTEPDRRRAYAFYRSQRPEVRKAMPSLLALLAMCLGGATLIAIPANRPDTLQISAWRIVPLFLPALVLLLLLVLLLRSVRYRPDKYQTETHDGPVTVEIFPEGYAIRRGDVTLSTHTWSGIPAIGSNEDFFIIPRCLLRRPNVVLDAFLIPRHAFATSQSAEEFLAAARRWYAAQRRADDEW